jgi:PTH1 family peptidyl-tRNA hydrolase
MVVGLGNPGPEYDATRHNVGWWAVDRLVHDWGFDAFEREGDLLISRGERAGEAVEVIKPTSYMNRSGLALASRLASAPEDFDLSRDLLVVVDDVALEVGRVRLRPQGSPGGHNGLKSIDAVVGGGGYGRLRIGVGACPRGTTLVDWVLSDMEPEDEDQVVELLPMLGEAIGVWMLEGAEAAMSRFNR